MSSPVNGESGMADILRARALLMLTGLLGGHRLYLKQVPEAFIFFSTAGVFLLGIFHDTFYIHSIVEEHNRQLKGDTGPGKFKKGRLLPSASAHVSFSLTRFIYSVLYGTWLGLLVWLAGTVTFGRSLPDSLALLTAIAVAIVAGVFFVGNCAGEQRDLIHIWIGAFTTIFVMVKVFDAATLRSVLFSAVAATLLGNRSAKLRNIADSPFNKKHFMFWCSLFCLLVCVTAVGASRHLIQRKVTVSDGRVQLSASLGTLLSDRWHDPAKVHRFFGSNRQVIHESRMKKPKKKEKEADSQFWWLDVDAWAGGGGPSWAEHSSVFIVDVLRAEARSVTGSLTEEPLKWASWRAYLLVMLELRATSSDTEVAAACVPYLKMKGDQVADIKYAGLKRACQVATS